jgi:hypothetical protein
MRRNNTDLSVHTADITALIIDDIFGGDLVVREASWRTEDEGYHW